MVHRESMKKSFEFENLILIRGNRLEEQLNNFD